MLWEKQFPLLLCRANLCSYPRHTHMPCTHPSAGMIFCSLSIHQMMCCLRESETKSPCVPPKESLRCPLPLPHLPWGLLNCDLDSFNKHCSTVCLISHSWTAQEGEEKVSESTVCLKSVAGFLDKDLNSFVSEACTMPVSSGTSLITGHFSGSQSSVD